MFKFGEQSLKQLATCHSDLQVLFNEVIKYQDCKVLEGFRNEEEQNRDFEKGMSQLKFPKGKHNSIPSLAVDVAPFYENKKVKLDWNDKISFYFFGGRVLGIAEMLLEQGKIRNKIRWGGDWNMNNDLYDQSFFDLVHFEIK